MLNFVEIGKKTVERDMAIFSRWSMVSILAE